MLVCRTIDELRRARRDDPTPRHLVGFVPTMGALHAGHMTHVPLVREALLQRQPADPQADPAVWVSIFVNPTQFGPHEDFQNYPRTLDDDLDRCRAAGVTGVFAPDPADIYPPGQPDAAIDIPDLAHTLEGAARPGHFAGVCRVVLKLINLVEPGLVTLSRKDYQQLLVCTAMLRDLFVPTGLCVVPTHREPDGLAMSSRNAYLTDNQRPAALGLARALAEARHTINQSPHTTPAELETLMAHTAAAHGFTLDYAAIRHPDTLQPLDSLDAPTHPTSTTNPVALLAGRLPGSDPSTTSPRLIDNAPLFGPDPLDHFHGLVAATTGSALP
ncbi:MAG: pantoate--beta-alanine ligase [Planctomycetota bacterium]